MARISTYPISQPTVNDILIGSDADNLDVTKNYLLGDIIKLIPGGSLSVQSLNTLTGVVTLQPKGGLVITEVGNVIFLDASNVGQFDTLSTNGTTGAATLTGTATVTATGSVGTGGLSAVTITGDANFTITTTDIVGISAVNGVTVTGDANIPIDVTGSGAVGIVGIGFVWGLNVPNQDPNWKEIAA